MKVVSSPRCYLVTKCGSAAAMMTFFKKFTKLSKIHKESTDNVIIMTIKC